MDPTHTELLLRYWQLKKDIFTSVSNIQIIVTGYIPTRGLEWLIWNQPLLAATGLQPFKCDDYIVLSSAVFAKFAIATVKMFSNYNIFIEQQGFSQPFSNCYFTVCYQKPF